jgi:hypothetical protein
VLGRAARTIASTMPGRSLTEVWLLPMKRQGDTGQYDRRRLGHGRRRRASAAPPPPQAKSTSAASVQSIRFMARRYRPVRGKGPRTHGLAQTEKPGLSRFRR